MKPAVQVRPRLSLTSRRRAMGLSSSRYLRAPFPDETPLSLSEVNFAIARGLIERLPARRGR